MPYSTDFTLADMHSQVQLLTGHDGLTARITTWTNRVLQDIGTRAFWGAQIKQSNVGHDLGSGNTVASLNNTNSNSLTSHFMTLPANSTDHEMINVLNMVNGVCTATTATNQALATYYHPLVHENAADMLGKMQGGSLLANSGTSAPQYFAMMSANVNTGTTTGAKTITNYLMAYPQVGTKATVAGFLAAYLGSPTVLAAGADTNWILEKYFRVVLSGVLRYAWLYLGNIQGYLNEKSLYENGIRDAILAEEAITASTPVRRGVYSEQQMRTL